MKASEKLGGAKPTLKSKEMVKSNVPRDIRTITAVTNVKASVVPKRTNAKFTVIDAKLNTPLKNPPWNSNINTPPPQRRPAVPTKVAPSSVTKPKIRQETAKPKQALSRNSFSEVSIDTLGKSDDSERRNTANESEKNLGKNGGVVASRSVDSLDTHLLKSEKKQDPSTFYVSNEEDAHVDNLNLQRTIGELKDKVRERDGMIERLQIDIDSFQESQAEEVRQYRQKIANLESTTKDLERAILHLKSEAASTSVSATLSHLDGKRSIETTNTSHLECDFRSTSGTVTKSVECLQDRISEMEETHHSTNEELAATLKELSDSHQCTSELRTENEKLRDENFLLLDSISHLSEKVNFYKTHTESILRDPSSPSSINIALPDVTNNQRLPSPFAAVGEEREKNQIQELQSYVKSLRDEKEVLVKNSVSLDEHIQQLQQTVEIKCNEIAELRQEIANHRVYLDSVMKEKEKLVSDFNELKSLQSSHQTEIQKIQTSYDVIKSKYDDFILQEKLRIEENKPQPAINNTEDFEELMKQRGQLEAELQAVQENLQEALEKVRILDLEASDMRNELIVCQKDSKEMLKDLEIRLAKATAENSTLSHELSEAHDASHKEEKKYQKEMRENLRLRDIMCQMELEILQWKQQCESLERSISQEKSIISAEREEWQQFQSDLLLVVRAANDFKTEAQETSDRLHKENLVLKDRINTLENKHVFTKEETFNPPSNRSDKPCSSSSYVSSPSVDIQDENKEHEDNKTPIPSIIVEVVETPDVSYKKTDPKLSVDNNVKSVTPERPTVFSKSFSKVSTANTDVRRNSYCEIERVDPLTALVKITGGSKRNALLKWCQNRTSGYKYIDITNFSTSWNDGMALCALLHTFIPEKIPYDTLTPENREENFKTAFEAAEFINIETSVDIKEMISVERPAWEKVMCYVKDIYVRLEGKAPIV